MSSVEEDIPAAPAFCVRKTPEEAKIDSQKATKLGVEQLYHNVVDSLKTKDSDKEVKDYSKMKQQSKLMEQIELFFECDEERQKAKFMNMLIDNNRNIEKISYLSEQMAQLEKLVNELKDTEEHLNEIINGYDESEREYDEEILNLKNKIKDLEATIEYKVKVINSQSIKLRKQKFSLTIHRLVIFLQFLVGLFIFFYY